MTGGYHPFASSIPGHASTLAPEAGAQCARRARWDLRGGPPATAAPTAISPFVDDGLRARAFSVAAPNGPSQNNNPQEQFSCPNCESEIAPSLVPAVNQERCRAIKASVLERCRAAAVVLSCAVMPVHAQSRRGWNDGAIGTGGPLRYHNP